MAGNRLKTSTQSTQAGLCGIIVGLVGCYHSCMRSYQFWVLAAALFATACLGQEPSPTFRYNLQGTAGEVDRQATALTPDNDLLVLLSLKNDQWILKRITGWDTNSPHEDRLALDGRIPGETGRADDSNLTVSPNGDILAVRFCFHHIQWAELSGSTGGPGPDAVVVLIDLRRFTVISRRITTDPIIAAALWRFNKEGELIASGLEKSGYQPGQPIQSQRDGGTYAAEVLKVPDLQPKVACTFAKLSKLSQESWPRVSGKNEEGRWGVRSRSGSWKRLHAERSTIPPLQLPGFSDNAACRIPMPPFVLISRTITDTIGSNTASLSM